MVKKPPKMKKNDPPPPKMAKKWGFFGNLWKPPAKNDQKYPRGPPKMAKKWPKIDLLWGVLDKPPQGGGTPKTGKPPINPYKPLYLFDGRRARIWPPQK
jgi:hypothetical protein